MKTTAAERNAMLSAIEADFNSGKIRLYSGTRPADADTALSGNTLLAELTFGATAFGSPSAGVLTANAIASGVAAATGTASFVRITKSDGTTVLCDLSIAVSGSEVSIATLAIVAAATVSLTSLTITAPVGS